jgi:hypothetical protein
MRRKANSRNGCRPVMVVCILINLVLTDFCFSTINSDAAGVEIEDIIGPGTGGLCETLRDRICA